MHFFIFLSKRKRFLLGAKSKFSILNLLEAMDEGPYGPSVCHENKKIFLKLLPLLTLVCIREKMRCLFFEG